MSLRTALIVSMLFLILGCMGKGSPSQVTAGEIHPLEIEKGDRCPVCGMYVKDYENWAGEIFLEDKVKKFDDPGCLMIYYSRLSGQDQVRKVFVRDYYTQEWIDATGAYFVTRARIYTPMGYGLVPFQDREKAESFREDHPSGAVMTFQEVLQNMERIGLE
jgi:nitrous oxide reductase accessory protein NosL